MTKLLTQFAESPTLANARRVVAYAVKHPMAVAFLTAAEFETLVTARVLLNGEG
jgi:hypothetical protein